ncbi:FtsQ-type POTRA domain-containing protein [Beduinella massiliensis]|uniref:FtsQ-type POTRA domain-containing protein n=1 Tax=Beduinella massiliensis TaxID=1852363 RepID=UPI000C834808
MAGRYDDDIQMQEEASARHPGRTAALVLFVLLLIGFFVTQSTIFVLHSVQVDGGGGRFTAQQIADIAGLRMGQPIFSLNEEKIKKNVESNRYLRFEGMDILYPDSLVLRVEERQACATVTYLGVMFVLDDEGRVLEQYGSESKTVDVPVVTGLKVKSLTIGETLQTEMSGQMEEVRTVLAALSESEMADRAVELNVSDSDNLYLMTLEGLKIELGDASKMDLKLSIAQEVLRKMTDTAFLEQVRLKQEQVDADAAEKRKRAVQAGTMTPEEAEAQAKETAKEPRLTFELAGAKLDVSSAEVADFVPAQ